MILTLLAVSLNEQALSQPITAHFDSRGGTMGRADHNTMALPDPERHVSRMQAEIIAGSGGFLIRNVGTANPVVVSGRVVAPGESTGLAHGDEIRVGGYLLQVESRSDDAAREITRGRAILSVSPSARLVPAPSPAPTPPPPPRSDVAPEVAFGQAAADRSDGLDAPAVRGGVGPSSDPFAGLLGAPAAQSQKLDAFAQAPQQAPQQAAPQAPPPALAWPTATAQPTFQDDPFANLAPQAPGIAPASQRLPEDFDPFAPPTKPSRVGPTTPLSAFGALDLFDDLTPGVHSVVAPAAMPPSAKGPPQPSPAPPPAVPAEKPETADALRLWAALCQGAGVNLPLPAQGHEERFREVGRLLHSAVAGTLRLMAVRASTRHELRAQVTIIQAMGNNPMKFSPDAKTGLEYLLQPTTRGFLNGPAAMEDAMQDLVGHAVGTVAGMRAAIEGMLERFAPQALEAKLTSKSVLDTVLPLQRKAKLWDQYLLHHESIRADAQDDFQTFFGKAFLAAYDEQIDQLKRNTPSE
jgi:FHA domain-containing protein